MTSSYHRKGLNHHGSQKDHLVRVSSTKKETFLNLNSPQTKPNFPETVAMHQLKHVHPLVLNLFPKGKIGHFPLAGRLPYFLENWKILTNNPKILEWVSGLKIEFAFQESSTPGSNVNARARINQQEVEAMLRKGSVHLVHSKGFNF